MLAEHAPNQQRGTVAPLPSTPAFVDNDYNEADQVVENLHRNEITPRGIADYIGRELATGKRKSDIARDIGKSPAFVTRCEPNSKQKHRMAHRGSRESWMRLLQPSK